MASNFIDQVEQFAVLVNDLVLLQAGQLVQAQFEDCLRLLVGQAVTVVDQAKAVGQVIRSRGTGAGPLQHAGDHARLPAALHQRLLCLRAVGRGLDQADDLVDIRQRHGQAFQDVGALARLAQVEHRAPRDHVAAVTDKGFQALLEVQQLRTAVNQRHHVDAEHVLQLGMLVEVVQHHLGHLAALQVDHHAHAVLVRLVAQPGDALDLLVLDQLGDLFQQPRLVHLVRQLGNHDLLPALAVVALDMTAGTDVDATAPGPVGLVNAAYTIDDAGGREIRPRHMLHQAATSISGFSISARQALMISPRLCGGILVAMPTAMPAEPLTSRFGTRVGNTEGSCSVSS